MPINREKSKGYLRAGWRYPGRTFPPKHAGVVDVRDKTKSIVLGGLFIALAVGAGFALAQFPNIELVTATVFFAGCVLGAARGAVVGAAAEFIYSVFNPYGVPTVPVLGAQIVAMAVAGAAGGWIVRYAVRAGAWQIRIVFGLSGFALTLFFDFLTTLGTLFLVGSSLEAFVGLIVFGSLFYLFHLLGNTLIFAILIPIVWRQAARLQPIASSQKENPALNSATQCETS